MKTGVWYDSALKRDLMYWLEFDPDVVSYTTIAISFNFYESGKLQQYIPDFQVIRCQKKQIIDVKSKKTLQGNRYKRRYQQLTSICNNTGWTFVALSELEVRKEPIFSNIKLLYRYARESFSIDQYRSYLSVMYCLLHSIRAKEYVKSEYARVKNNWTSFGLMETLKVDNGTDFRGKSLEDACRELKV